MATQTTGRHRAPGRYNPFAEIGQIAASAGEPIAKGSAILAASGGLVAAIAVPASAASSQDAATDDVAATAASQPATATPAVTAPSADTKTASAVSKSFGTFEVTPVAKPKGPSAWQLRMRAEREAERREQAQAAEREQQAQEQAQQEAAQREQASASRTSTRTAPSTSSTPSSEPTAAAEPAPSAASGIVGIAKQYTGVPYVYGGSTPAGFDCSGFTQYVYAKAGKSLPRVTTAQQAATTPVSNPQPGDLVFFGSPSYHVGIYVGGGKMIDAPRTGSSVSVRDVFSGVSGYGRL